MTVLRHCSALPCFIRIKGSDQLASDAARFATDGAFYGGMKNAWVPRRDFGAISCPHPRMFSCKCAFAVMYDCSVAKKPKICLCNHR